jgi:hypothetical protein
MRLSSNRVASRGFVLPVVLVMLVVMTTLVLFNMRRSVIDERLAANVRQVVSMETAATYALRYCEVMLTVSPPGRAALPGLPDPPRTVDAPPQGAPVPAWRDWTNWSITPVGLPNPLNRTVVIDASVLGADVERGECLFEDATDELVFLNTTPTVANNAPDMPANWQKYRITAEVQGAAAPGQLRVARAQSELRISVN